MNEINERDICMVSKICIVVDIWIFETYTDKLHHELTHLSLERFNLVILSTRGHRCNI